MTVVFFVTILFDEVRPKVLCIHTKLIIRELNMETFSWRRNFNRKRRHDLCNIAHALAHHIAVVLPSAT